MPNLVVYVPAAVARVLEAKGVSQDIQRKACNEVLAGLANGGLGAGEPEAGRPGGRVVGTPSVSEAGVPVNVEPSSPAPSSFRPDFKKGK